MFIATKGTHQDQNPQELHSEVQCETGERQTDSLKGLAAKQTSDIVAR
jgi:hypothetical protein